MGVKDTTIWVKPENQPWQALGVETARGIWAEDVQLTSDMGGPSAAQFTLHRDTRRRWPDLGALTPVEVEVGGVRVWSGQLKDTPTGSQAISVNCDGAQADLDGDLIRRFYVHDKLSDWKDLRGYAAAPLGRGYYFVDGGVDASNGALTLRIADGTALVTGDRVGVILDLGPGRSTRRLSFDFTTSNNNNVGQIVAEVYGVADPGLTGAVLGTTQALTTMGAAGTQSVTLAAAKRYLLFNLYSTGSFTVSGDAWWRLTSIRAYADPTYESANRSVLRASTVVKDALASATTQIIQDFSTVAPTSFDIPSLAPDGPQTARQLIQAVNAYHNWQFKITEQRRPVFRALPTVPIVKAGAGVAFEPEDSSAGASEEIYDKVLASWNTPEGIKGELTRTATGSVVARRGRHNAKELQIGSTLPADAIAATQIADTWLDAHQVTPFKGSATITGPLEHILTGGRVEPERLLMMTGELLLFDGMIDPDTAAVGRSGRINQVTYTPADDVAKVTIDDSRSDVDALLARLAVVTGGG